VNLRPSLVLLGTAALAFGGVFALSRLPYEAAQPTDAPEPEEEVDVQALPIPSEVRAVIIGGGSSPESNQLSLEEDVRLASETFGDANSVRLFAGGPGTRAVQVADAIGGEALMSAEEGRAAPPRMDENDPDDLRRQLGDMFYPHGARDAHYVTTTLSLHGPSTLDALETRLLDALTTGEGPLTLYIAGHGDGGETPSESRALFWGGEAMTPADLALLLEEGLLPGAPRRPLRVIATTCFSGGFAELAFRAASRAEGPTDQDRCGLFATSWDEEASGCDPDPDRAQHEGFGVHFLMAMQGRLRDGTDARATLDLDHNGRISPTEALTQARIAGASIDIPTTTSEALLEALAPAEGARIPFAMPEQARVVAVLGASLGLDEAACALELSRMDPDNDESKADLDEALAEMDTAYARLTSATLSRWPVLDDPFHPHFERVLRTERNEIKSFLSTSPEALQWMEATDAVDALSEDDDTSRIRRSMLRRLMQAYETQARAERLQALGGPTWERYLAMRACEWAEFTDTPRGGRR